MYTYTDSTGKQNVKNKANDIHHTRYHSISTLGLNYSLFFTLPCLCTWLLAYLSLFCAGLTIGFAATRYSAREGSSVVPVVRILSGELAPGLSVPVIFNTANFQAVGEWYVCVCVFVQVFGIHCNYMYIALIMPSHALHTAPGDYSPTTQVIQFTSVNSSYDVTVPLRLDFFYEADEIFFGDLQLQSTPLDVIVDPSRANLSIVDNNRKHFPENCFIIVITGTCFVLISVFFFHQFTSQGLYIGFTVPDVQVPESAGDAVLRVELTGAQLSTSVQIQFNTIDGTALGR